MTVNQIEQFGFSIEDLAFLFKKGCLGLDRFFSERQRQLKEIGVWNGTDISDVLFSEKAKAQLCADYLHLA